LTYDEWQNDAETELLSDIRIHMSQGSWTCGAPVVEFFRMAGWEEAID
jgi:hypothetical protein